MHIPSRHDPRRRRPIRARPGAAIVVAVFGGLAGAATLGPSHAAAAGASSVPFAEAFDRARLVVVATVDAAPPSAPGYRLTVERVVKGPAASVLTFRAEETAVPLVPASRVLLLAMDPASLDFRGTWALAVGADGTIEADGFSDAPATVDELLAAYGEGSAAPSAAPAASAAASGSPPPTSGGPDAGSGPARGDPPASLVIVAILAAVAAAGVILVAVVRARADRHEG